MPVPTINQYCGAKATVASVGKVDVYFSYTTPVAFRTPELGLVCTENAWGVITGRHLNVIQPDKKRRLPRAKFVELLATLNANGN